MNFKGIILDFNGTLVWDTLLHKEAWIRFCRNMDITVSDRMYYNTMYGKSTTNILELLLQRKLSDAEIDELTHQKENFYRQSCIDNPDIYRFAPGVEDFLDFLAENNIPRNIATASEKVNLDFFIETLQLNRWFNTDLFVYDDGNIANKPEPDIYLRAAERLDLRIDELAVVEDTYYGALAAKRAGAGYLIITGPAEDQHDELNNLEGVDLFISDFSGIDRSLFSL